jgi:Mce-associated membrane protein
MRPGRSARAAGPVATRPAPAESRTTADAERLRREIERLRWIPAIVAAVVVATLLVLCVWQSHGVWWGKSAGDNRGKVRQEVLAAAKPCVAAIVSYDYRHLAASEKAGQACITGAFKADYTKAMETTVRTLAPQSKTVQVFQIAKAGIERVSPDGKQWVVLLYGQQQVTNSTTAKNQPRLDILNVEATLTKVGPKWLVSSIH